MRKNKKLIMVLAIVLAIATATAGATFAWFTSIDTRDNHMETGQFSKGDVKIAEVFDEDDKYEPDVDINKDVWVVNESGGKALVRVSFAEILTLLDAPAGGNPGDPAKGSAVWAGGTATIPQITAKAAFDAGGIYDGFTAVTAATLPAPLTYAGTPIPAGVTLMVKEYLVGTAPNQETEYGFVAYAPISGTGNAAYDGQYQKVLFNLTQDDKTNTVTFSDWGFMEFIKAPTIYNKWATFNLSNPAHADMGAPFPATATLPHAITLPASSTLYPSGTRVPVISDPNGYINLVFTSFVKTDLSTCVEGDWWYNAADGFFYYIGALGSGKPSNLILDAVGLHAAATEAYCLLEFDLIVKMEAIQNVEKALSSSDGGGWNLSGTILTDLTAKLDSVNAFVL
ncbi:MAG: hypothetical protein FWC27_00085 [Firmicutes bacterium]|nr:hypothetical protein [Bacillota bacterium]